MEPASSSEHHQLAVAALEAGSLGLALTHAEQAVALDGSHIGHREHLARVHYRKGNLPAVIAIYQAIVEEQPQNFAALKRLARLLLENWQFERADHMISRALAIDAADVPLLAMQIFAKHELGQGEAARAIARAAEKMHPGVLSFALDARLLLPMVYADTAARDESRQRFTSGIEELHAALPMWLATAEQVFSVERSNFLLAYQGCNDRALQQRYSAFLGKLIHAAAPELKMERLPAFDGTRRLKIGFVSKWFYASTAGSYFERWITQLDPARFERYVYYTGQGEDDLTHRIEAGCEHFVRLQNGPRADGSRIVADQLDVLVHPEVGMSTGSYLLAAMRLAPVQVAAWGHPVTTGSDAIDYYLSCRAMEPEGHAAHYSEQVILLDGIGVDIPLPPAGKRIERAALGLPADAHLYFCPQSLYKIHPDMDEVFLNVLARDSRAVLVFFQAGSRAITLAFADRLAARMAGAGMPARGQVKFLPRLGDEAFRRALGLADVMLDTLHWSGGGTSLDAFAADVPVVSLPGAFMRGRQTAAMLAIMELERLIANDLDDYVSKAIELATDRALNQSIRDTIAVRKSRLFGRTAASREFAEAIYAVALGHAKH